jgi:hypothetical protein
MLQTSKEPREQLGLARESDAACFLSIRLIFLLKNRGIYLFKYSFQYWLILEIRVQWADYLEEQGIQYAFYSAANISAMQEARRTAAEVNGSGGDKVDIEELEIKMVPLSERQGVLSTDESESDEDQDDSPYFSADEGEVVEDPRAKVLSVDELERAFIRNAPELSGMKLARASVSLSTGLQNFQILPVYQH